MTSIQQQINEQITGLYIAFFDRAPDAAGLEYWYNIATEGGTEFTNPDYIYDVAAGFASHPVFVNTYDGMTDEEFVEAIYYNLLDGFDADQSAMDFWLSVIDAKGRDGMVAEFVTVVLEYEGTDADAIARQEYFQDKVDVGVKFAAVLGEDSNPENLTNLENDPAYLASIFIMDMAADMGKDAAIEYINTHNTLDMWTANQDPTIEDLGLTLDEDSSVNGAMVGDDIDYDTLSFTVTTPAANGTVDMDADGTFSYTPDENFNGTDSFIVTVNDGNGGTDTATVSVTVDAVNDAPVAGDAAISTNEDSATSGQVQATDVDGDTLTYSISAGASNGSVTMNPNGTFTYTPNEDYNGSDSFTYEVTDGDMTDTATVNITVNGVNDAPETADISVITNEDTATLGQVVATDIDGDALIYTVTDAPANGTVGPIDGNGNFTYTPNADYNGDDSFEVTVTDGNGGSATSTVNVTVTPVNDAPVAQDGSVATVENVLAGGLAVATDIDNDDATLIYSLDVDAEHGTVSMNQDGSFTYTPDNNWNGTDTFTYEVTDGDLTDSGEITVNVAAVDNILTPGLDDLDLTLVSGDQVVYGTNNNLNAGDLVIGNGVDSVDVYLDIDDSVASTNYSSFELTNVSTFNVTNDSSKTATFDLSDSGFVGSLVTENSTENVVFAYAAANDANETNLHILNQTQPADFVRLDVRNDDTSGMNDVINLTVTDSQDNALDANLVALDEAVEIVNFDTDASTQEVTIDTVLATGANDFNAVSDVDVQINNLTLATGADIDLTAMNGAANISVTNGATIHGTEQNDVLTALSNDDYTVNGNGGNDTITTLDGNDIISGGEGNDTINAGNGNNIVNGDAGADTITTGTGNDTIYGGTGDDTIDAGTGTEYIDAGADNDTINGGTDVTNADRIIGGAGDDELNVIQFNAYNMLDSVTQVETINLSGGAYNLGVWYYENFATDSTDVTIDASGTTSTSLDLYYNRAGDTTLIGSNGNDYMRGSWYSALNEVFDSRGTGGDDIFIGFDGNDTFMASDNSLTIADTFSGGAGTDTIELYNSYNNVTDATLGAGITNVEEINVVDVTGYNGNVNTGDVNIVFDAAYHNDTNAGIATTITINAQELDWHENLTVDADANNALESIVVNAGDADDYIRLGAGNDTVNGNEGNDTIAFTLDGTFDANDTVDGGEGTDRMHTAESVIVDADFANVTRVEELFGNIDTSVVPGDYTLSDNAEAAGIARVNFYHNEAGLTLDASTYTTDLTVETDNDHVDTIVTGAGNDNVSDNGYAADIVVTNDGDDTYWTAGGDKTVTTGEGNDTITTSAYAAGNDNIDAGTGDDIITSGAGTDTITAGEGNDIVNGMIDDNTVDLGAGDDLVNVIHTGAVNDVLDATDSIQGGTGTDTVNFRINNNVTANLNDVVDLDQVLNVENYTFENNDTFGYLDPWTTQTMNVTFQGGSAGSVTPVYVDMSGFNNGDMNDELTITLADGINPLSANYDFTIDGSAGNDTISKENVGANNDIEFNAGAGDDTFVMDGNDLGASITYDGGSNNAMSFDDNTWTLTGGDAVALADFDASLAVVIDDNFNTVSNVEVLRTANAGAEDVTLGSSASTAGITTIDSTEVTGGVVDVTFDAGFANNVDIYMGATDESYDASALTTDMNISVQAGQLDLNDTVAAGTGYDTLTIYAGGTSDLVNVSGIEQINLVKDFTESADIAVTLNSDAVVDSGKTLVVDGTTMADDTDFWGWVTFDGSAETDAIQITTAGGRDTITTGSGDDIIDSGNSTPITGNVAYANDTVNSGAGNDTITTGDGDDTVNAGADNDTIYAGTGNDTVNGEDGDDTIYAGAGDDIIDGGAGNDTVNGEDGDDTIDAGAGDDIIDAGAGNDTVNGEDGNDTITAGEGADTVTGGLGADMIDLTETVAAVDTLVYTTAGDSNGLTLDIVTGFDATGGDLIDLSAVTLGTGDYLGSVADYSLIETALTGTAGDVVITEDNGRVYVDVDGNGEIGAGDMTIQLDGITTELTDANFIF